MSDAGVGAILSQKDDSGEEFVISFASKACPGAGKDGLQWRRKLLL